MNFSTLIVLLVLVIFLAWDILYLKENGIDGCSGNCDGCHGCSTASQLKKFRRKLKYQRFFKKLKSKYICTK